MAGDNKAMLEFIVPRLIKAIMEDRGASEKEAFTLLYSSRLYEQLDREETKLWHLSVPTLYEMWAEEQDTGKSPIRRRRESWTKKHPSSYIVLRNTRARRNCPARRLLNCSTANRHTLSLRPADAK